jgi:hypothetical protein
MEGYYQRSVGIDGGIIAELGIITRLAEIGKNFRKLDRCL